MSCQGVVKSFSDGKGWGFITYEDQDVFVHFKDCVDTKPNAGDEVTFDLDDEKAAQGQMKALNVVGGTGSLDIFQNNDKGKGKGKGKAAAATGTSQGAVKSFNASQGWGFIECEGVDVFLHLKECVDGGMPQQGDWVAFDMEESPSKPGTMRAKNVTGGTGAPQGGKDAWGGGKGGGKDSWGGGKDAWGGGKDAWGGGGKGAFQWGPPSGGGKDAWGGGKDAWGGAKGGYAQQSKGWSAPAKGKSKGGSSTPGEYQGTVKSFSLGSGWGFVDLDGTDVFIHGKECVDGGVPQTGDVLTFDMEESPSKPGTMRAKNIAGGTGTGEMGKGGGGGGGGDAWSKGGAGKGGGGGYAKGGKGGSKGQVQAEVKSFSPGQGWGFLTYQGSDVFCHIKDCVDGMMPVQGDWVFFDLTESESKPGQLKAANISGGTGVQPVDDKGKGKGKDSGYGPVWGGGGKGGAASAGPYGGGGDWGKGKGYGKAQWY